MNDKITGNHLTHAACGYPRQSTTAQLERNRASTARPYPLVEQAAKLDWRRKQVHVIDEDLGLSGEGTIRREDFERIASEVMLGPVGLILAILQRNTR